MTEVMQKCDNCFKQFPEHKIATHYGYCRRNIKKCQKCGEMYDINYVQQHQEEFHKKIACKFCKNQFGTAQVQKHESSCTKRTQFCQYCQLNVPVAEYRVHLQACEARTKQCDKCMKPVANKQYLVHLTTCKGIVKQTSNSYNQYLKNNQRNPNRDIQKIPQYYDIDENPYPGFKKKQPAPRQPSKNQRQKQRQIPQRNKPATNNFIDPASNKYGRANIGSRGHAEQPGRKDGNYDRGRNQRGGDSKAGGGSGSGSGSGSNQGKIISRGFIKQQPKKRENPEPTYGIKRPIQNKKQQSNKPSKYTQISQPRAIQKKNPPKAELPRPKLFDPQQYGGYPDQNDLPMDYSSSYQNPYSRRAPHPHPLHNDEQDDQLQKAIIQSLQQQNKIKHKKQAIPTTIPKELQSEDLMNTSFYRDIIDIEKQKAEYEEMQRQALKNPKRGNGRK